MEIRKCGVVTIGRGAENDLTLEDARLSRRHCRFVLEGDALVVEDLGSMNGTSVNGDLIEGRCRLRDGDAVRVGPYRLTIRNGAIVVGWRRRIVLTRRLAATG